LVSFLIVRGTRTVQSAGQAIRPIAYSKATEFGVSAVRAVEDQQELPDQDCCRTVIEDDLQRGLKIQLSQLKSQHHRAGGRGGNIMRFELVMMDRGTYPLGDGCC